MPNPKPPRQNRMPISNNLWPSIAPLKNRTADRSGSFREASPPMVSPAGWAKAESAPRASSATTADIDIAMLRVKLAVASQVRIDKSSNKNVLREKTRFGSVFRNQNFEASELQFASSSPRELKDLFPE